ncbi:hypothetical protein HK096_005515 [Nowakowskiella sp. JEL0078]|nr:hypothetical protein HK096_005515 [Nowakowskiella sp. JEL0078]
MSLSNKALVQPEKFAPQVIQFLQVPTAEENEVIVQVKAAALNPVDWKIAKYGFLVTEWPAVLGVSGSGVISSLGSKVSNRKIGERVLFNTNLSKSRTTSFQQYAATPNQFAFAIPDSLSFDDAATLSVPGITSAAALFRDLGIVAPWEADAVTKNKGKSILIWGAASSAGYYAVQFANKVGLKVIATASPANHNEIKELGASHVFDYRDPDVVSKIHAIVGDSLTLAYDTIGIQSAQVSFDLLSKTSRSAIALIASQVDDITNKNDFPLREPKRVFGSNYYHPFEFVNTFWNWFIDEIAKGNIKLQPSKYIGGLEDIIKGQEDQINGNVSNAKLVVRP